MSDGAHPHEIIIVKRHGGGHEDGHHGGAWKIAYADFVTAMMAFFLVMWLISANDKTKAVIARYFNPVQLVDSTPQPPGLSDPKDKDANVAKPGTKPAPDAKDGKDGKTPPAPDGDKAEDEKAKREADLLKDPPAALDKIAAKDPAGAPVRVVAGKTSVQGTKGAAGSAGLRGGEAFRDPFAPMSPTASGDAADPAQAAGSPPPGPEAPAQPPAEAAPAAPAAPLPADPQARAVELKSRIEAVMKAVAAAAPAAGPRLEVKATPEGTLITLTDDARFAMFASASAEPSPRAVVLLAKIGRILKEQKGNVVIRGFTDGRKFRSDTYDNWRLSSARADMAHFMLARGGLDEARIERIEGYADRQPRDAKDPDAPENRRIEILVRAP